MAGVMETAARIMARPWRWGEADCCMSACDVFAELYGIDPAQEFRGRYSTRAEAEALIAAEGGFVRLLRKAARRHGLVPSVPREGALGIFPGEGLTICIKPGLWIGKTEFGFTTRSASRIGWHVPC